MENTAININSTIVQYLHIATVNYGAVVVHPRSHPAGRQCSAKRDFRERVSHVAGGGADIHRPRNACGAVEVGAPTLFVPVGAG